MSNLEQYSTDGYNFRSGTRSHYFELSELGELKPIDSRYFVCNHCRNWNLIKEEDLKDIFTKKKIKKKDIHLKIDEDLALIVKKLSANFGGYENMFLHLINNFYKSQPEEKTGVTNNNGSP